MGYFAVKKISLAGAVLALAVSASAGMGPNAALLPATVTVMGLTYAGNNFSAMCIACHTENPSTHTLDGTLPFSEPEADYRGSHFVRNKLDGTDRFTANKTIEKITVWVSSGALSKYGDTATDTSVTLTTGEMLCESCHNLISNVGYKLLVDNYNPTTGDSSLCNGCHTAQSSSPPDHHPQSGHDVGQDADDGATHTLTISHSSRLITPVPNDINRDPNSGHVGYYGGVMSCMSCHKPHDAMTSTGARILRRGRSRSAIAPDKPVNVVYAAHIPSIGYLAGQVIVRSTTGLHRQSDMLASERLVTNYDPLCQSCH